MVFNKKITFSLILILFFMVPYLNAQEIKTGVLHFPPFYVVKSQDKVSGYYIDVLKKIYKNAGIESVYEGYPPKRLYQYVAEGKVDVWMGTKGVSAYQGKTYIVEDKISDIHLRCFSIGNSNPVSSEQDLIGKKIITILGYNYAGFIQFLKNPTNNIKIDESSSHELAFKKLKAGRANYLLDYKFPADEVLKTISIPDLRWYDLKKIGIYILVPKKTKNSKELFEKLSKSVKELKLKGEI